jgi:hypothetical protein
MAKESLSIHPGVVAGKRKHPKVNTSAARSSRRLTMALAGIERHLEEHPSDAMSAARLEDQDTTGGMMTAEEKKRTGALLDAHIRGAALNAGAWMKSRSGKRRLARGQIPPSRIELLADKVYGIERKDEDEYSPRHIREAKAAQEFAKRQAAKPFDSKYMHAHARRQFLAEQQQAKAA